MTYLLIADVLVLLHLAFVAFVVLGALLVLRWPRLAWVHIPCAAWGALIEFTGWVCPLTPLEVHFRRLGGDVGYAGDFIAQYVLPVLYPAQLTRPTQWALGALVVAGNVTAYLYLWRRRAPGDPDIASR
ncbi:MAG: DUF2784 domain-containing protein [Gemmatimonadetes bacterium]|nr:DUF2784 domain-containing protein [Gemmatimonadota bacterium]